MAVRINLEDDADVPMSPLIDCVFLLLIFFLVTTMIKKKEMQIPVALPDATSSISKNANEDAHTLALDEGGMHYYQSGKDKDGFPVFKPIVNIDAYLSKLSKTRNPNKPLIVKCRPSARWQQAINLYDKCKGMGFSKVGLRLIQEPLQGRRR